MTVKYKEPCCVSSKDCLCPAGYGSSGSGHFVNNYSRGGGAKLQCFSCGEPVCQKCSQKMNYLSYGKQVICDRCCDEQTRRET